MKVVSESPTYVFVYGTLRYHEPNHPLLATSERICEQCWVHGRLYDTGYGYPALGLSPSSQANTQDSGARTYGELYKVSVETLRQLDMLEGYYGPGQENYYERVIVTVHTDRGAREANVYVFPEIAVTKLQPVPSGDWVVYSILEHEREEPLLYFAYGSCMDHQRFLVDGVEHYFQDIVGRGVLSGYTLKFTRRAHDGGRADIVEIGGTVEGKVYRIPREAVSYLHRREGVEAGIYRPTFVDIVVDAPDGASLNRVLTYTVVDKESVEHRPPSWYLEEILRGSKGFVSEEYRRTLMKWEHS